MEAVKPGVMHGRPVNTGSPAGRRILSSRDAGHTERSGEERRLGERGLMESTHVVEHLHAVREDVIHSVGDLRVPFLQVLEVSGLLLVLVHQSLDVLPVDPD